MKPENSVEISIRKWTSYWNFPGPKIEFLVKIQQHCRTDKSAMIDKWLGCRRSRFYQNPAMFPASLAGDLKGNKACSVSRQSCHLDRLHITNAELSMDCSSRKALPQKRHTGHCLKKLPVLEVPAPKTVWLLLKMTVSKQPERIMRQGWRQQC